MYHCSYDCSLLEWSVELTSLLQLFQRSASRLHITNLNRLLSAVRFCAVLQLDALTAYAFSEMHGQQAGQEKNTKQGVMAWITNCHACALPYSRRTQDNLCDKQWGCWHHRLFAILFSCCILADLYRFLFNWQDDKRIMHPSLFLSHALLLERLRRLKL